MSKIIQVRTFTLGANHGQLFQALGSSRIISNFCSDNNFDCKVIFPFRHNHFLYEIFCHLRSNTLFKYLRFFAFWIGNFRFWSSKPPSITVYGSDMIWCSSSRYIPKDDYFWGSSDNSQFRLSFSPSIGLADASFKDANPKEQVFLRSISNPSVRDSATFKYFFNATNSKPVICADPFLIYYHLVKGDFTPMIANSSLTAKPTLYLKKIKSFRHSRIFVLLDRSFDNYYQTGYYDNFSLIALIDQLRSPMSIINQFHSSSFIITDTFHGVLFALACTKPFLIYHPSDSVLSRLSVYQTFFSEDRIIKEDSLFNSDTVGKLLSSAIDVRVDDLNQFVAQSLKHFNKSLETCLQI